MAKIEQYAAREVWDPPTYSQAVKVTGGETILYLSGQVAYSDNGGVAHPGDFKAQARAALQALKAQVEAGGGARAKIVKGHTYLTHLHHPAAHRPLRRVVGGEAFGVSGRRGAKAARGIGFAARVLHRVRAGVVGAHRDDDLAGAIDHDR